MLVHENNYSALQGYWDIVAGTRAVNVTRLSLKLLPWPCPLRRCSITAKLRHKYWTVCAEVRLGSFHAREMVQAKQSLHAIEIESSLLELLRFVGFFRGRRRSCRQKFWFSWQCFALEPTRDVDHVPYVIIARIFHFRLFYLVFCKFLYVLIYWMYLQPHLSFSCVEPTHFYHLDFLS